MKLTEKEMILTKEIVGYMHGFEDLTTLSYTMLKALRNAVCNEWSKIDNKRCVGCPLNTLGMCRRITEYCDAYEDEEVES